MRFVVELRFDLVAGSPVPQRPSASGIFRQRIAALDHEALDDAMKTGAVVETLFGKGLEILDRFWSHVRPEFDGHFTVNWSLIMATSFVSIK